MTKNKPDEMAYLWMNVPKDLMARARAICDGQQPRIPLKLVLRHLLQTWVDRTPLGRPVVLRRSRRRPP